MTLRLALLTFLLAPIVISGCATLEQVAALRQVQFSLDDVENVRLAGVQIDQARSIEDVGVVGATRIGAAAAQGRLPLAMTVLLGAENPDENAVTARLVQLDWTLLLDDTETISGLFNDDRLIPPGQSALLPIGAELDLIQFFDGGAQQVIRLAFAIAGEGQQRVAMRLRPTVNTPFGPISYPGHITVGGTIGS